MDFKKYSDTNNISKKDQKIDHFFEKKIEETKTQQEEYEEKQTDSENSEIGKILHSWEAPEFESYEKSLKWYIFALIFICTMAGWGIVINSPIMSITFILIGIVGYIQTHRKPRILTFSITTEGVLAGREFYPYENMHSFWIFYDPPHIKAISLHTAANLLPYVHIPLEDEDPVNIREFLLENLAEVEQDHNIIDTIERVFNL
jgi:hypothetical protein